MAGLVVLLLGVALATGAAAHSAPAQYLQLVEINVEAGSEAQFEAYVKKIREAADKVGAPQGWTFAQPLVGASYVFLQHEDAMRSGLRSSLPCGMTRAARRRPARATESFVHDAHRPVPVGVRLFARVAEADEA